MKILYECILMGKKDNYVYILLFLVVLILVLMVLYIWKRNKTQEGMNGEYTAVIVEPRKHKALKFVLDNFYKNLDDRWSFLIIHGSENKDFVMDMLDNEFNNEKNRTKTHNLKVTNLTIEEYNKMLTSKSFYDVIPTETFLIFQTDSIICKSFNNYIYKFLEFDYVGAPNNNWVGNGGLSLRKKSKILEVLDKYTRAENENEDVFFTKKEYGLNIPDIEMANQFSNEGLFREDSFGVHKPWWYLSKDELREKNMKCPGLKRLIKLNK